jgi:NAD(P)-dependent dehydrogenase (short-subunit alcohol dehydrogenase family)
MASEPGTIVLVTGASSGIGRACAAHLHERGYRVYGTTRRPDDARKPEHSESGSFERIPMDVTCDASVERGVASVLACEGRIDAVVNNAGFSLVGAVEDTLVEEARAQLETNFFGAVRVCRAVLPVMRTRRKGWIVNVSSIGGLVGLPFQAFYSASKFALEGFTEALRMELRPYAVRVALIEPGDVRTSITANRRTTRAADETSPYRDEFQRTLDIIQTNEINGSTPEKIARLVEQILLSPSPRLRYPVGSVSERFAVALKKALPASVFERMLMKYYGLR